jgi:hypothetical protein
MENVEDGKCVKLSWKRRWEIRNDCKDTACHHIMCDFVLQTHAIKSNSFKSQKRFVTGEFTFEALNIDSFSMPFFLYSYSRTSRCNLMPHSWIRHNARFAEDKSFARSILNPSEIWCSLLFSFLFFVLTDFLSLYSRVVPFVNWGELERVLKIKSIKILCEYFSSFFSCENYFFGTTRA